MLLIHDTSLTLCFYNYSPGAVCGRLRSLQACTHVIPQVVVRVMFCAGDLLAVVSDTPARSLTVNHFVSVASP